MATIDEFGKAVNLLGQLATFKTELLASEATDGYIQRLDALNAQVAAAGPGLLALGVAKGETEAYVASLKTVVTTVREEKKDAPVKEGADVKARIGELVAADVVIAEAVPLEAEPVEAIPLTP